jgi:hypothetical protein
MQPVSVQEVKKYWDAVGKLVEGESMECLYGWQMPPWEDLCSELNWRTHLLDGGYFATKHYGYCGVYRLVGLASEGDLTKPASLDRVCGKDTTGTLYIGHAKSLHSRLNQLRRSSSGHQSSHNAGRPMNRTLRARFPSNKLAVAILSTGATTFRMIERDLIQAYMNSFGDTPPLNYSLRA